MNRDQVKAAADALGRLEALEEALASAELVSHGALPVSFFSASKDLSEDAFPSDRLVNETGIKAYYPREEYIGVIELLAQRERAALGRMGVEL